MLFAFRVGHCLWKWPWRPQVKHVVRPRPRPRPGIRPTPTAVGRWYGCASGGLEVLTSFAIVAAMADSSFVPSKRVIISPNSARYTRGLVCRRMASNSAVLGWSEHLATSAKFCSAEDIMVGSRKRTGAEASCLSNWRAASTPPKETQPVFNVAISSFSAFSC